MAASAYNPVPAVDPNPWAPPIRHAVIAWYAFGLLWSIAAPFWLIAPVRDTVASTLHFGFGPPSGAELTQAAAPAQIVVWTWVALTVVVDLVAIAAAIRRWAWAYVLVVVLLGAWFLDLVFELVSIPSWNTGQPPLWSHLLFLAFAVVSTALGAWMIVAFARRKPSR